ncbi:hypothetical protein MP228_011809 [Amoeboaphelidium protococcarum]|nr:hypothetical protein MP228_011809 [Amoeboaphelidium protococcarum]
MSILSKSTSEKSFTTVLQSAQSESELHSNDEGLKSVIITSKLQVVENSSDQNVTGDQNYDIRNKNDIDECSALPSHLKQQLKMFQLKQKVEKDLIAAYKTDNLILAQEIAKKDDLIRQMKQ